METGIVGLNNNVSTIRCENKPDKSSYIHTYVRTSVSRRDRLSRSPTTVSAAAAFAIRNFHDQIRNPPQTLAARNSWKTASSCERTLIVPSSCSKQKDLAVPRTPASSPFLVRSSPLLALSCLLSFLSRCGNAGGGGSGEGSRRGRKGGEVGRERGRDGGEVKERPRLRQITPRDDVTMQLD